MDEQQFDDNLLSSAILPPHSIEAEQSVLGGLLIDNNSWEKIADLLTANDFYRREHRIIYSTIAKLIESARPADILTVQDALKLSEELEQIGGFSYLVSINQNTPSAANIRRYAEIVRERSLLRQLAEAGTEIANTAYQPQGREAQEILDKAEQEIFRIAENSQRAKQGFIDMPPLLTSINDRIQMLFNKKDNNEITGLATKFKDLDKMTAGLQAGDLIIVAGRPSMGKTAFAMNIAENVAIYSRVPVAVFSMEMSAEQLAMRMIGSVGRIDQSLLRTGRFQDEHWEKFGYAQTTLADAPIFIDETPALTVLEIRTRCRRLARQHNGKLGLIVIDYLQLMSGSGRSDNRVAELGEITRSLKSLAKELSVPVILLSQLSRAVEQRTDKRPMMSDLRESGAIEQDADLIIFMYRDEYYHQDKADNKGLAEAIIGKHRNGPTGKVDLIFIGQHARFENKVFS